MGIRPVLKWFCTVIGFVVLSGLSSAGETPRIAFSLPQEIPYDEARFNAAVARRDSFVIAVVAEWCTVCNKQEIIVAELLEEPRFKDLTLFIADFDRERELRRRLRIVLQSTFVVFNDGKEVARATGQTDKAVIAALFAKAL
jgi:thiol-disulfide isomerase/thioredoxin